MQGKRRAQSDNFREYYAGQFAFEEILSSEEIFLETMMFALRTSGIPKQYWHTLNHIKVQTLIQENFLSKEDNILVVTKKGIPL